MLHRLARTAPAYESASAAPVRAVRPDPAVARGPSVTLACGEVLYADLVVGADGVKSTLQKAVMGLDDRLTPTGNTAYRTPILCLRVPSELRPFVETPMTAWMAPGRHLMTYCIPFSFR